MSPAPSESLALQCVKLGGGLKICDGIIFKFHPGLLHNVIGSTLIHEKCVTGCDIAFIFIECVKILVALMDQT